MYQKINNYIKNNSIISSSLLVISAIGVLYLKDVLNVFSNFLIIVNPILIGLILAFLINVPMKIIENKVLDKISLNQRLKRSLAIVSVFVLFILFVIFFINIIVPDIQKTLRIIQNDLPIYFENMNIFFDKLSKDVHLMSLTNLNPNEILNKIDVKGIFNSMLGATTSLVDIIINIGLGVVFAFHLLLNKEIVKDYTKKIVKKTCNKQWFKTIRKWYLLIKDTFSKFLIGQITDACILGIICYIVMSISKIPYASVICLTIAITALIPIIGAWVGSIVGFLLIIFISPVKAIIFIVEFILIQQVDNHFIYPNIVGKSIGLESVFVVIAIIIGGGVGGALGMLIAIPVISIIIQLIDEWLVVKNETTV